MTVFNSYYSFTFLFPRRCLTGVPLELELVTRSTTPENIKTITESNGTPRKAEREVQESVDNYLKCFDAKLGEYLAGRPWNDFWKAPPASDPLTAAFIDALELPRVVGDDPVLLLHGLGNGIVDECVVDSLFTKKSQ